MMLKWTDAEIEPLIVSTNLTADFRGNNIVSAPKRARIQTDILNCEIVCSFLRINALGAPVKYRIVGALDNLLDIERIDD